MRPPPRTAAREPGGHEHVPRDLRGGQPLTEREPAAAEPDRTDYGPVIRFASRASTHEPFARRKSDNVRPERRNDVPSREVTFTATRLMQNAQSPRTRSSSMSLLPSSFTSRIAREVAANSCFPNGSRPGTRNTASSAIRLRTFGTSPALLAVPRYWPPPTPPSPLGPLARLGTCLTDRRGRPQSHTGTQTFTLNGEIHPSLIASSSERATSMAGRPVRASSRGREASHGARPR